MDLIMYSRSTGCPFISLAYRVLAQYAVDFQEIMIDKDVESSRRVLEWTGFLSVPTLVVANPGETLPYIAPSHLPTGASPRGIDRGAMITEPNKQQLEDWLKKHNLIRIPYGTE